MTDHRDPEVTDSEEAAKTPSIEVIQDLDPDVEADDVRGGKSTVPMCVTQAQ